MIYFLFNVLLQYLELTNPIVQIKYQIKITKYVVLILCSFYNIVIIENIAENLSCSKVKYVKNKKFK